LVPLIDLVHEPVEKNRAETKTIGSCSLRQSLGVDSVDRDVARCATHRKK